VDAVYIPSAPCGGDLPFRTDRGVANYYGVGGYLRPLEDTRRAEVRFASECLAFSNVPDETAIEEMLPGAPGDLVVHHPRWKAGVPRDAGSGWDFEDVRDHYLELLHNVDPVELRRIDHERYLELSRAVTGEVMAEVFGEWRRAASPCGGGLVLWLRDLVPGAGWGMVDHHGEPKVAYSHLRRVLAPVAVWTTDEGLGGVLAHVANDRPAALTAQLRVALYRDLEHCVGEAREIVELSPHSVRQWDIEALLGRFVDASWAYRFGPSQQDLIVVSLELTGVEAQVLISQSVRFPAGRPVAVESPARLGLEAITQTLSDGALGVCVRATRLAYGVRLRIPGFLAADDAFSVEPGRERVVPLRPREVGATYDGGVLTALNLEGRVLIGAPLAGTKTKATLKADE
jgi:beta-mannosidase